MANLRKSEAFASALNFVTEVRSRVNLPNRVVISDNTLREGEQAVPLGVDDKVMLAHELDELGVHQIQAGCPGRSKLDQQAIRRMKNEGINAKIEGVVIPYETGFPWRKHIDLATDSESDIIQIIMISSPILLEIWNISEEQMIDISVSSVQYSKDQGNYTVYCAVDATRTSLNFLKKLSEAVVNAGAERFGIADTLGVAIPSAMNLLVQTLKKTTGIQIEVHCHNDFGLALANSLAAVEAGAEVVDATVNGIGDRCGGVSLDEIVMALETLYGMKLGIKTQGLYKLSKLVEKIMNFPMTLSKPLVGERAFSHTTDTHVRAVTKFPPSFETISPEVVGNKRRILLGKYSGPIAIETKAKELGLVVPADEIPEIVQIVEKISVDKRSPLTDEEFIDIITRITKR
jgi:2-isopropylmalate synthase